MEIPVQQPVTIAVVSDVPLLVVQVPDHSGEGILAPQHTVMVDP